MFDKRGVFFWPVGTSDSTTIVVRPDDVIVQVDLRHTFTSEDEEADSAPVVDRLVEVLPQVNWKPYLSAFALTHPDKDHVQGFEDLLNRVTIGELWFTPRVFREQPQDGMCPDAVAFRKEAHRRAAAAIAAGGDPGAGDRLRLIGYDTLLEEEKYAGFPTAFFSVPGHAVTMLDGEELAGEFRAFIHGPFRQDEIVEADRNDTSLCMQLVLGADPAEGGVLLLGDQKYQTIRKIIDNSRAAGNEASLAWSVLLAPHHCSKSAMYQIEEGLEVLKQDLLDDLATLQVGSGWIVSSSHSVPSTNVSGNNPPHAKAKARYEEIADGGFLCTHDDGGHAEPLWFAHEESGLAYDATFDGAVGVSALAEAVKQAAGTMPRQRRRWASGCAADRRAGARP